MKNFKAHILIVDDDDRIRDLVKEYLNQNNYPYHNFDVLYDFEIKYKLSENAHFQISVNNINPHINTFKSLLK